jgi:signal transduction histidine kinase
MENGVRWSDRPSWRYVFGIGMIGGIGLGTVWIHLLDLLARSVGLYPTLVGAVVPLGLSVVILGVGAWVHWSDFDRTVGRIGAWCLVGTVVLVGVSVVSMSYQYSRGAALVDPLFVMADHATAGAILGSLIGIYDSQRHRRRDDLRTERRRARELSNRLTVLNRVLRHDIRSAVNVIQGNAALLENDVDDPDTVIRNITEQASELEAVSDRARRVEQLLERDPDTRTTLDIGTVLQVKTLTYKNEYPDVDFETDVRESIEVYAVSLIEDAIDELLDNAIEHNDTSTPTVGITAVSGAAAPGANDDPGTVVIRISDNGPGIPENALDVLERGHETDLDHLSGIGLWLAHWAVRRSNGEITFEENDPRGSVVEIRLRAVREG